MSKNSKVELKNLSLQQLKSDRIKIKGLIIGQLKSINKIKSRHIVDISTLIYVIMK